VRSVAHVPSVVPAAPEPSHQTARSKRGLGLVPAARGLVQSLIVSPVRAYLCQLADEHAA